MADDIFEDLYGIEDEFYEQGFKQGLEDGVRQSRVEARIFGIEKGFEKALQFGKVRARALKWQQDLSDQDPIQADGRDPSKRSSATDRIQKHIESLIRLVDTETLSLANDDDAVAEFDDRLKKAQSKITVIERLLG